MKASEADLAWPTARLLVLNLRTAGRYREALSWVERVLAVGPTGPQLGLALTFQSQLQRLAAIRGDEAESSLEKALELVEPEDQSFVLNELGRFLRQRGHLQKAAEAHERSAAVGTAIKGADDLGVAASLHELAGVLQAQGDLSGARERLEKVLEIEARIYGTREHYSTAITEMVLGFLLLELKDRQAAAELLVHAYSVFLRDLGPDHRYTRQLAPLFEKRGEESAEEPGESEPPG